MLGPFSKKQCSQLRKQGQITLYLLAPFSVFRVCVHVRVCVRAHPCAWGGYASVFSFTCHMSQMNDAQRKV